MQTWNAAYLDDTPRVFRLLDAEQTSPVETDEECETGWGVVLFTAGLLAVTMLGAWLLA